MGILSWIVMGLLAGVLAKLFMGGPKPAGCLATIALGILGALVGGWIATLLGFGGVSGFDLYSLLIAILGSAIVLLVYQALRK